MHSAITVAVCEPPTGSLRPAWPLQVVIDAIPPAVLVSDCSSKTFDFGTISDEDLLDIKLPLQLHVGVLNCFTCVSYNCWTGLGCQW